MLATLVTGMLLSTVPAAAPVEATSAIQRCESPDGTLVYTDKSCAAFSAKAVPMSGELLTRIAHEDAFGESIASSSSDASSTDAGQYADAAMPLDAATDTSIPVSRRGPGSGCARTPTQLAMDLRDALGLGDVNRVAVSYDWVGMSNRQGQRTMDRLQQLIGKPVIDSHYFDAQITSSPFIVDAGAAITADASNERPGDAGMLQLTLGTGAQATIIDVDVRHYSGCYFVRY
ncbi:MAG: hypothetical protein ACMG5Z_05750 [Luteimonas sp.]